MDAVIITKDGPMDLEQYVARVTTAENGAAAPAALEAQAIAARTFVLRAMRDDPTFGTQQKPIPSSERFQVAARTASQGASLATDATRAIVATYMDDLIIANFVAGAVWNSRGQPIPNTDPKETEKFVTYNYGRSGAGVQRTRLSGPRTDNRGCMSQNGANWLARHGWNYPAILRYFYGADLGFAQAFVVGGRIALSAAHIPPSIEGSQGEEAGSALPAIAVAAALAWWLSQD